MRWKKAGEKRGVIVTNTTYKLCPWADILYAMDKAWWRVYGSDVARKFNGEPFSGSKDVEGSSFIKLDQGGNSGVGAIRLAEHFGAKTITLLGYDCRYHGNRRHWHPDHPSPLGNAGTMPKWAGQFEELAGHLGHIDIVNASQDTALLQWPLSTLKEALSR